MTVKKCKTTTCGNWANVLNTETGQFYDLCINCRSKDLVETNKVSERILIEALGLDTEAEV